MLKYESVDEYINNTIEGAQMTTFVMCHTHKNNIFSK